MRGYISIRNILSWRRIRYALIRREMLKCGLMEICQSTIQLSLSRIVRVWESIIWFKPLSIWLQTILMSRQSHPQPSGIIHLIEIILQPKDEQSALDDIRLSSNLSLRLRSVHLFLTQYQQHLNPIEILSCISYLIKWTWSSNLYWS